MVKKAILVAGFGSSYTAAWEKAILPIEEKIKQAFSDYDFERAFLSGKIIKILQSRNGMQVENVLQVLEKLVKGKVDEVIIQPLLVINGIEYEKLLHDMEPYRDQFSRMSIGTPLLNTADDFEAITQAIQTTVADFQTDAVLFMGHGSEHPANEAYAKIKNRLDDNKPNNIYIATIEGSPTLEDIIPQLKQKKISSVTLIPFMLVAGDHASNDMAGDNEDSWKSILEREGFQVEINLTGIGEWTIVQSLLTAHAATCIGNNQ